MNCLHAFIDAMRANGIETDAPIVADGQLHRFRVSGDKAGKENGWYVLHGDGVPAGAFGCWKRDLEVTWCAKERHAMTETEQRDHTARIERARKEREREREQVRADCKEKAERLWSGARDTVNADHPYLVRKGVRAFGVRQLGKQLLVPVRDEAGTLVSLQVIGEDGEKRFLTGTPKTGNFHRFGSNRDRVLICEGYATAASLHETTGDTVAVAFDCGNLLPVARVIRQKIPNAVIVLCADNDTGNAANPGLTHTTEAARAVGGLLAVPVFPVGVVGTDFNDLHQQCGAEAVRVCLASAQAPTEREPLADTSPRENETQEALIRRLATLSDLAYFQCQKVSAETLGISPGNLDRLVKAERARLKAEADATEGGSALLFDEVEPWPDPVDGAALLSDLVTTVRRYVVCEKETAEAAALWVTFTWLIDAVSVAPIANITAPLPNCGKSTLLGLLERLAFRPLKADNISAAALFRSVEKWRPTLLIDEVDAFLRDNEDARGVLNSGHQRNGFVLRVVGEDFEPRRFSTWGAKALCGIGSIAATLQSRSIRLELRRKLPGESVDNLRHMDDAQTDRLRQRLARFAADAHAAVKAARPAPVPGLSNRASDNWEPLLAIADIAGGDWPTRARRAATTIAGLEAANESPDTNTQLLADVRAVFDGKGVDRLSSADLLAALCEDEEDAWATWNRGRPMTARQLAQRLREFGVTVSTIRIGLQTPKGYIKDDFRDAFARYLPSPPPQSATPPQPSNGAGFSGFAIRNKDEMLRIEKSPKPSNGAACGGVADRKGGTGHIWGKDPAEGDQATPPDAPVTEVGEWQEGEL